MKIMHGWEVSLSRGWLEIHEAKSPRVGAWMIRGQIILSRRGRWVLGESIEGSGPRWEPTAANWGTIGLSGGVDHHHQPQHIWTLLDELQSDARCTMHYALFTVHNMWGSTMGLHNILYELPLMSWWTMLRKQFQIFISLQYVIQWEIHMNMSCTERHWLQCIVSCVGRCLHHRETPIRRYGSPPACQHHQHHEGFWLTGVACYY